MGIRLVAIAILLCACTSKNQHETSNVGSMYDAWRTRADGQDVSECVAKIPLERINTPDGQRGLISRIWMTSRDRNLPLFFTYTMDNFTYVIFHRECRNISSYIQILNRSFSSEARFEGLLASRASSEEARSVANRLGILSEPQ